MPRTDFRLGVEPADESSAAADGPTSSGEGAVESLAAGVPLSELVPRTLMASPTIVMLGSSSTVASEKFQRLKTKIVNEYKDAAHVIVVTSAAPREGKSFLALNLALAFAGDPGRTVLVDADLRRPTVHRLMNPEPALGLSEVLRGTAKLEHALVRLKNSPLRVLPGGKPSSNPADLISSAACKNLIASLREQFQRVIIDTPPVVPFTDADTLGACADGVIMVARSGSTPRTAFTQALSLITSTRILGTVLNDVTFSVADYGHYHDYYHSYYGKNPTKS
jgi:capsular exopolysaccharide synthesis family protein